MGQPGQHRRKAQHLILLFLGLALVASACASAGDSETTTPDAAVSSTSADSPSAGSPEGDTLVIAIPGTPSGVDMDQQSGPQTWTMGAQIIGFGLNYDRVDYPFAGQDVGNPLDVPGLTYPDLNLQALVPGVLESCTLSEDGREAFYNIRDGVVSSYGNQLTADDILWGVERSLELGSIGAFFLAAGNANDLSKWEKVDDLTVRISSDTPMAMVCALNAHLFYAFGKFIDSTEAKKHVTAEDPWASEWLSTNSASFGPYYITEWSAGEQVVMEANPNYYGETPAFSKIIWRVVPESSNRIALLAAGDVDMVEGVTPEEAKFLDSADGVRSIAVRSNGELFIVMDNSQPPFDDPRVRQAMNLAIPRSDIANQVYLGLASEWQGVIPEVFDGYVAFSDYNTDLDKARSLLDEAGYSDGFEVPISFNAGDPIQEQVSILLKDSLAEIGVSATLEKLPPAAASDLIQSGTAKFGLWSDAPFLPDPGFSTRIWYHSETASNWQNYKNDDVDRLIDECNLVVDWDERLKCHEEIQQLIYADAPHGWISSPYFVVGMRDDITGFAWDPALAYHVAQMAGS